MPGMCLQGFNSRSGARVVSDRVLWKTTTDEVTHTAAVILLRTTDSWNF